MDKELYQKVEILQNMLVDYATGDTGSDIDEYESLRLELCSNGKIKDKLPAFLFTKRTSTQFWQFIKNKYSTYRERREFLWDEFAPVLSYLETDAINPLEVTTTQKLAHLNEGYIKEQWDKALQRKANDPEGAITSARTLIETVCKYILDQLHIEYDDTLELPKLYKLAAKQLNLAPEQHNEDVFKQVLGGCQGVVEGLGSLRNKLSDAHGKRKNHLKPSARHAELAINLAATMSIFLLETFNVNSTHASQ